ncbi:MAG TPA: hypothetical protein VF678_12080, partial [bacterium]
LQVAYAPQFRRIFTDARIISRYGVRQVFAKFVAQWRAVRPQTGWAWHEILILPLHAVFFAAGWVWERGVQRTLVQPLRTAVQGMRERRYALSRVKGTSAAPIIQPSTFSPPQPQARPLPQVNTLVPDAFATWMDEPEPTVAQPIAPLPSTAAVAPPTPPPPPQPRFVAPQEPPAIQPLPTEAPGADRGPDRVARWEEYLRRYKENLDLDWDERSWKRKRLDDLARDSDDEAGPQQPPK